MKNSRRYVQSQTGGVHVIVLVLIVGAVFISLIFMDVFTVYISKHISQKGADAAALAASMRMNEVYEDALRQKVNEELNKLAQQIEQMVQQRLAEAAEEADEEGEGIELDPEEIREQILRSYPDFIANRLRNPNYPIDAIQVLKYFKLTDRDIVGLMCTSIGTREKLLPTIREEANYYAEENDADELVRIDFPYNGNFEVFVRVKRKTSFMTVPDQAFAAGQNDMYAEAAAKIRFPTGLTYRARYCR